MGRIDEDQARDRFGLLPGDQLDQQAAPAVSDHDRRPDLVEHRFQIVHLALSREGTGRIAEAQARPVRGDHCGQRRRS